jgi:hypothetical protein
MCAAVAFAIVGGAGFALAQQSDRVPSQPSNATVSKPVQPPAASNEQESAAEKAVRSESGRAGTSEPSVHAPAAKQETTDVLGNGRLAVPGAPTDSETVPAKFSERNAALDELPTMAHPLSIDAEQRRRIWDVLKGAAVARTAFSAQLAVELPNTVELQEIPRDLSAAVPAIAGYKYTRSHDRVLLVLPASRVVVGEIARPDQPAAQ